MTIFSARNASSSTVPASSEDIWRLLTDPATLAELTPMVQSIEATDSHWKWTLDRMAALGQSVDAVFTERMEFTEGRRIVFSHDPPAGTTERTSLDGIYDLNPVDVKATDLAVDLTLSIDLTLPKVSATVVQGILGSAMEAMGRMFASNLYDHLGLDSSNVDIKKMER